MTVPGLALWQTGTAPQKTLRLAQGGAMGRPMATFGGGITPTTGGGSHGVVGENDLKVTGSTLTPSIAAGSAFINGTSSVDQGPYFGYNHAATSAAVTLVAHNTNPRIDLVVLRVMDDPEDSTGSTLLKLDKVTGTPAGSPTPPTVPPGCLVLAQAAVPANSGAVVYTDKRVYATALGGLIRCTSTTRPTGAALWFGQHIIEADTNRILYYNGSAWRLIAPWRTAVSGSSISGAFGVGTAVNSITLPDMGAAGTWVIQVYLHVQQNTAADTYEVDVTTGGTRIGYSQTTSDANAKKYCALFTQGIGVNSGDTPGVAVTLRKVTGTADATTSAILYLNRLEAVFWPST